MKVFFEGATLICITFIIVGIAIFTFQKLDDTPTGSAEENYLELASEYGLTEKEALELEEMEYENVEKELEYKGIIGVSVEPLRYQDEEIVKEKLEAYAKENNIMDPKTAEKLHKNAIENAEGKLSGDLSCYSTDFINKMTAKAEKLGEIIDVDCDTAVAK